MSAAKQQSTIDAASAVAVPSTVPLLVDIKAAAQILGTSVFNVRNLCWHHQTRNLLSPVRLGKKYLFSPAKLTEFAAALVAGRVEFPRTPVARKRRRA